MKMLWSFCQQGNIVCKSLLVTSGSENKYHVPDLKLSPFPDIAFSFRFITSFIIWCWCEFPCNFNSFDPLTSRDDGGEEIARIPTKVRQIECSRNAFGTNWTRFFVISIPFLPRDFFFAANDSWWISFRWRTMFRDEAGGWLGYFYLRRLFWEKIFMNKILSVSSPLFPIKKHPK